MGCIVRTAIVGRIMGMQRGWMRPKGMDHYKKNRQAGSVVSAFTRPTANKEDTRINTNNSKSVELRRWTVPRNRLMSFGAFSRRFLTHSAHTLISHFGLFIFYFFVIYYLSSEECEKEPSRVFWAINCAPAWIFFLRTGDIGQFRAA